MTTEEMKAFERRFFQAWNEGKPEILDEVYSPAFINHFNGENLDATKQGIIRVRAAFSDFHLTLDDQIAGG
jgi:SnoaL-like domain